MLNFRFNVNANIEVNQVQYPLYFEKRNICVHCGAEGQIIFVDKFGNETRKDIYPLDHMKCKACGRTYSIMWKKDLEKEKMYPVPVETSIKQEFLNMTNYFKIKSKGVKEL